MIFSNSCHQVCGCYGSSRTWVLTWLSRFVIDPSGMKKVGCGNARSDAGMRLDFGFGFVTFR